MQNPSPTPPSSRAEPILLPALKVGVVTGCSGFFFGGIAAVVRSTPTIGLFALGTGINCFALGSTYTAVRLIMFRALHDPYMKGSTIDFTPKDKVYISSASGSLTGAMLGFLLRGRSNVIPGAIFWGLMGMGGQYAYNAADARHTEEMLEPQVERSNFLDRAFASKWNPVKKLTDEEYVSMLRSKLLAVEAELAITNEEIEKLEKSQRRNSEQQ
ncbi:hypothetical protein FN846DRAFT_959998 [Sphaerosporella brunnea]|uniref:Tim17/Tim22/Tim23/Pmp24 family-domain-containing protein n=1 Tax=Sphaerosporella brunnea TaxID=1250544 RepID=A0A5J5ER00_9PEZI|nr:hypothetical protein FN846DRAFT_959998 [Sphaerosporella brunnea]